MSRPASPHRFNPSRNLLSMAICMAVMAPALADETREAQDTAPPATLELGATAITSTQLGSTTEGSESYTTGTMATATKLPLTLRETPQAVTVITRQRMDDQAMTSINDVVNATPGLFLDYSSGPGRQAYKARGFDIDNLMYDGIPSGYNGVNVGSQPNLAMFDRVEVVRGATGLVTGAGNPSAAINLVRKRPLAEQRVTLTGAAGTWDNYRGELDASSPLNDSGTLRGRVVTSYRDANSFIDDVDEQHGLFYAVTEADLSDDTTLTLGFSHQKDRTNYFWGSSMIGLDGHHLDLPRSYNPGTSWEDKDQEINTVFAEIRQQLANDWKLQVNANYSEQNALFSGSYQSRWVNDTLARTVYQSKADENQAGLDAFFSGPFEAFGRSHELVVGASKRIYDLTTHNYSPYDTNWPINAGKPDFVHTNNTREVTTQDGVYLTTRLSLADPLKLILGGRLDWYDYDNRDGDGDYKVTRNVTRYAGLIYELDDHHSVYASYSDIFTPQSNKGTSGNPVKPIVGKNYEVGIKGEYLGGALNASLAVFRVDQENRAVQVFVPNCPQSSCYEASGEIRSQGIDLELQGALTDNWQIGGGYTYARTHTIKDEANPQNVNKQFDTDTPEHLFKLTTRYNFQGPLEKLRVGGNISWQSRMYNDIELLDGGNYRLKQGAYAVTDLMAGYRVNENLDLQLNANNIFDRKYYSTIANSVSYGGDSYGTPRNMMLTAKYTF
ncbi:MULTISPECIES: TonB-dependent siderophore receptor [Pseudomonas]|uniref:TonB-dependent siderophore receptor n=1 Tax=Pseudomonas TaxID=286 RepID=UPI000876CC22|nr:MULTISPECIES: TonB-dependent siderophore receptor [Pseudomonas]TFA85542.1 outer membrane receptor for ferric coprogen and ferric-rhodotorulic acid [Pseudomonas sp. LAIL14HWK12:I2]SCZ40491.1 outer-membrane receptor for ferric coprogen and ferric-rhodotorulic acid [Pseudomonas sp. NFIX46]SDB52949.1 outer-membrane receptor for ferric coprogen and ferric-rhodotorulic acid [Pseudomonas putida]SFQ92549.1 outer-membrane receptor for ferric coprogen and ferric-rhodotorulic acid [Pseudomonas sp. NFIX